MTACAGGASLRREIRLARRELGPAWRRQADGQIRSHIRSTPVFRSARRVALFFAFDGEPDLSPLIRFGRGKQFFAPVISGEDMQFAHIAPGEDLVPNRFGIPEPAKPSLIDPRSIDLVLTPLVAFDDCGNRIGVGGGFYDRCFAFLSGRQIWQRPKLLGTAYALQQIERFTPNTWDVPLWGVVTEDGMSRFNR